MADEPVIGVRACAASEPSGPSSSVPSTVSVMTDGSWRVVATFDDHIDAASYASRIAGEIGSEMVRSDICCAESAAGDIERMRERERIDAMVSVFDPRPNEVVD